MTAAVVAALATGAVGATAASASTARSHPNATPACGSGCYSLYSLQLGTGSIQAIYAPGSNGQAVKAKAGDEVDLKLANLTYTNEDFTPFSDSTVGQDCNLGTLARTSYACLKYGDYDSTTNLYTGTDPVIEGNWSPDGNQSGLCVGVAGAGTNGENVTLRPCGASASTLFVEDEANHKGPYVPWVLGSDGNSSEPLVLQVNTGSKGPQDQLVVSRLLLQTGGYIANQDLFALSWGPAI